MGKRGKKTKVKNRTKFAIFAILNLTWFTITCLALSALEKSIPDSLIISWFGAWTVELGLLAGIKIKDKNSGE